MHIAIICDPIDKQSAGIYQYTLNLVHQLHLSNSEYRFSFITVNSKAILEVIPTIPHPNTIKFLVNDPIRAFLTLPKLINKLNPDIVIEPAHFGPFNLNKRIKRVTVIHDLTPLLFPQFHPFLSRFLQKIFLPRILKNADLILTNSEHTNNDVIKYKAFTKAKSKAILLGKDHIFKPTKDLDILKKHKLQTPYLLTFGTLEPRKNLITLLKAFSIFKQKDQLHTKLVLAGGKGWKNEEFENILENHPFKESIIQPGFISREEMPAIYSHCKSFIFPSHYEGFGLPLLEAMACEAPVIAANNSSLPEVGGDAAIYFETKNIEDLASKISLVCENEKLQLEMKKKGLEQSRKFSWENYTKEFLELIKFKFGGS